jgi:hypothetical protein
MTYDFGNMREYLIKMLEKESLSADDFTFTATPISMVMESNGSSSYYDYFYFGNQQTATETLSGIAPMVSLPTMVVLKPEEAKIKFTFSKQRIN